LGIEASSPILDLGCGIGRHTLELAHRGFTVTGVDRTQTYLNKAREKARIGGLEVEFVQADMRSFRRTGAFEAVINLFSSFGYFENPEEDRRVVENVYDSLKPGGRFLVEMMGKEV
ncbi:MAG: methyltransferase domain-containing protein, partial [Aliifodinibius sp.]|nr:class I SAM-dependent methyltransferase [Fodinibius sp.]NIV12608.1 methyltransferase domain-containing protein [Fodinibius sp.]NIY26314.1 methyltransferase domain-containing protein [Fodinibius sp.]